MYLVRGRIQGAFTKSMHPLLSSKIVQCTVGCAVANDNTIFNSLSNSISGITSRGDCHSTIYSNLVVDRSISVYSLEHQIIGQLA